MQPLYLAVSLPAEFDFPLEDARTRLLRDVVLPAARGTPAGFLSHGRRAAGSQSVFAIGGRRCGARRYDGARASLSRESGRALSGNFSFPENQHELCVAARKFNNLMPFGCWWFLNNPSIVSEITRERLELLGPSFIPQHSDARVLEHLLWQMESVTRRYR